MASDRRQMIAELEQEAFGSGIENEDMDEFMTLMGYDEAGEGEADPMTVEELQAIVQREIGLAEDWLDELEDDRERAMRYYDGEKFGDEEDGRSHFISLDVHDTIRGIMPSLLRVFFGPERAVEFQPRTMKGIQQAEMQTDYVNAVVMAQDNPGFMIAHSAFHDALLQKLGCIRWVWEDGVAVDDVSDHTGLTLEQFAYLTSDPKVEIVAATETPGGIDLTLRRSRETGKVRLDAIPPEEVLISPEATNEEDARLFAWRTSLPMSDLVAMGFDPEDLEEHVGSGRILQTDSAKLTRQPDAVSFMDRGTGADESQGEILYTECYIKVDYDGDNLSERRKLQCVGLSYEILRNSEVDEVPFALFGPDPRPHSAIGKSVADLVMDIQRTKSKVIRAMLDGLAFSIHPRAAVVNGAVNITDAKNTEVGSLIREDVPGAYRVIDTPFHGREALMAVDYLDGTKEERTGQSRASRGLDPDVLQSTTKAAVDATITGSQQQIELIARIFAETGWSRLMKGIVRTVTKNQDWERVVRLRDEFVEMDPRHWDMDLDTICNVAVGSGSVETRYAILDAHANRAAAVLQQMGVSNPLVSLRQYGNTMAKMLELGGFKDTRNFVGEVPEDWQPPESPPDPGLILAQAEYMKAQVQAAEAQLDTSLDWRKALLTDNRERDRMELDAILRQAEIEAKSGTAMHVQVLRNIAQSNKEVTRGNAAS